MNVTQIMQPSGWERLGFLRLGGTVVMPLDQRGHERGHSVRMNRVAPGRREYVVVAPAAPLRADRQPLGGLAPAVLLEDLYGTRVDADGP